MMSGIREAIEGAAEYLKAHPEEAEYTDGPASARIESGLRIAIAGPGGESAVTDMVASVGGAGSAPSPGWLLRAAEASCVATLIAMRAAQLGLVIVALEVVVDSISNDRGILGIDASVPAGPSSTRVAVRIEVDGAPTAEVEGLVNWAVDHCPVTDAVRREVPMTVEINR
jgi:uncharacterized OsmC-like protein